MKYLISPFIELFIYRKNNLWFKENKNYSCGIYWQYNYNQLISNCSKLKLQYHNHDFSFSFYNYLIFIRKFKNLTIFLMEFKIILIFFSLPLALCFLWLGQSRVKENFSFENHIYLFFNALFMCGTMLKISANIVCLINDFN